MSEQPNAYRVEVYSYSTIVGHMIGRQRAQEHDRTFRQLSNAERYSDGHNGVMSIFVPYMFWQSEVVPATMPDDWRSPEDAQTGLIMASIGFALALVISFAVFVA